MGGLFGGGKKKEKPLPPPPPPAPPPVPAVEKAAPEAPLTGEGRMNERRRKGATRSGVGSLLTDNGSGKKTLLGE